MNCSISSVIYWYFILFHHLSIFYFFYAAIYSATLNILGNYNYQKMRGQGDFSDDAEPHPSPTHQTAVWASVANTEGL